MPGEIFFAEEGSVSIGGTDFSAEVKDISITGGARGMNQVRTFGNNAYADEQPADRFEVSFTMVTRDADLWTHVLGGLLGAGGSAFETIPRTRRDVVFNAYDLTDSSGAQISVDMFSAFATQADFNLNSTDHGEQTPAFMCLTRDFRARHTANRVTNALS